MNRPKPILLIEDDHIITQALVAGLASHKISVQVAIDGEEGLSVLQQGDFSLVLLDLILPKMDGFAFLEKANTILTTKKIPVIILSNLGQSTDIERGKKLGVVDYLIKANTPLEEIVNKVHFFLSPNQNNQDELHQNMHR